MNAQDQKTFYDAIIKNQKQGKTQKIYDVRAGKETVFVRFIYPTDIFCKADLKMFSRKMLIIF